MTFSLGFSPCPNDTFIFDALVNKKIDTEGLDFEIHLEDVETLNQWAMEGKLDISKISYGVLPMVLDQYRLLDSGGALGKGVGPLLIAKKHLALTAIPDCRIAVPGQRTTAHLLFSLAFPNVPTHNKAFMIFSAIEEAILSEAVDCGVIIHENRFTYQQKGLVRVMDLGEFWERTTGAPIPLGGIVFRRDQPPSLAATVDRLIRKSLEYAFSHYPLLPDFVKSHAQEMDEGVMRQHIDLYVNDYSLSLGKEGHNAVQTLLNTYASFTTSS